MCTVMRGEKAASLLDVIPLSNDTVSCRIAKMATDVKEQLLENVHQSPYYSIQIDEFTDISNAAELQVYIRFGTATELKEELLLCCPFPTQATGRELFKVLKMLSKTQALLGDIVLEFAVMEHGL